MYAFLLALAGYLGIYLPLFVLLCRRCTHWNIPLWLSAPAMWVGLECVRNYMLTGISALMLGHTLAEVPVMIQIADLFGTYGVSFVIVSVNVALFSLARHFVLRKSFTTAATESPKTGSVRGTITACTIAVVCTGASFSYGQFRLGQTVTEPLATFALVQRDEQVEYQQDID
ncbi:apolipoprotein N-acyltransferase, partial [Rhodopirellula maiorica SM1]